MIHHQSDVIWCSTQGGSLLTEAVCVLSLLKIPAGKGAVVLFTYLLMSSWFIRKGTFSQPLSWRVLCKGRPGLPISLAEMMVGLSVMGLEGRGGEGLLHKHGSQSAGIAPHSRGASAGLYRGSLFCGPLHFLTHLLSWSGRLIHMYQSLSGLQSSRLWPPLNGWTNLGSSLNYRPGSLSTMQECWP